jgi:probable HAF family extracellular repeat protein
MSIRHFLLLSLFACAPAWAGPLYTATFLPENFQAYGIGNDGSIVGMGLDAAFQERAFVWRDGTTTFLPTPGASIAYATATRNGMVAGAAQDGSATRGFVWRDGAMQSIGTLYGGDSVAYGVNAGGQVVGASTDASGNSRAFLYSGGTLTDLGTLGGTDAQAWGINDAGMVVGGSQPGAGFPDDGAHAFLYVGGVMHDLGTLGGGFSWAEAVNDAGQVVGYSLIGAEAIWHPFLYSGGVMHDLGSFGGDYGEAHAINAAGAVVGYSTFADDGFSHAFVDAGAGLVDLNFVTAGLGSEVLMDAVGINDAGQIVANACNDIGYCAPALLTPVPEPAPALLLPAGGLALLWWRRRTARQIGAGVHGGAGNIGDLLSSVCGQADLGGPARDAPTAAAGRPADSRRNHDHDGYDGRARDRAPHAAPAHLRHHRRLVRQPGRVVRLLHLFVLRAVFFVGLLPEGEPDDAAAEHGRHLRGRLPDAAHRRLAVRPRR